MVYEKYCLYLFIFVLQREHIKSDWHRFNLKRKLKGQEIVSELKFEEITNAGKAEVHKSLKNHS